MIAALRALVARAFGQQGPPLVCLPAPQAVTPELPPIEGLSTIGLFVDVNAAVRALAEDIAGLPLIAVRRTGRGRKAHEDLVRDPALDALTTDIRKQAVIDWRIAGNAYLHLSDGFLERLHPAEVEPLALPLGLVAGYRVTDTISGSVRVLSPEEVIHIRAPSWQTGALSAVGESCLRSLIEALETELASRETEKRNASQGRPDLLFTTEHALSAREGARIVEQWRQAMARRDGAMVAGHGLTAIPLSWSPADLGTIERRAELRAEILASIGVPAHRVARTHPGGHASIRQAERVYLSRLAAMCRPFDDAFSRLAAPGVRIEHDFSGFDATQDYEGTQIANIEAWVRLGASPKAAAEYERAAGAPVGSRARVSSLRGRRPSREEIDRERELDREEE